MSKKAGLKEIPIVIKDNSAAYAATLGSPILVPLFMNTLSSIDNQSACPSLRALYKVFSATAQETYPLAQNYKKNLSYDALQDILTATGLAIKPQKDAHLEQKQRLQSVVLRANPQAPTHLRALSVLYFFSLTTEHLEACLQQHIASAQNNPNSNQRELSSLIIEALTNLHIIEQSSSTSASGMYFHKALFLKNILYSPEVLSVLRTSFLEKTEILITLYEEFLSELLLSQERPDHPAAIDGVVESFFVIAERVLIEKDKIMHFFHTLLQRPLLYDAFKDPLTIENLLISTHTRLSLAEELHHAHNNEIAHALIHSVPAEEFYAYLHTHPDYPASLIALQAKDAAIAAKFIKIKNTPVATIDVLLRKVPPENKYLLADLSKHFHTNNTIITRLFHHTKEAGIQLIILQNSSSLIAAQLKSLVLEFVGHHPTYYTAVYNFFTSQEFMSLIEKTIPLTLDVFDFILKNHKLTALLTPEHITEENERLLFPYLDQPHVWDLLQQRFSAHQKILELWEHTLHYSEKETQRIKAFTKLYEKHHLDPQEITILLCEESCSFTNSILDLLSPETTLAETYIYPLLQNDRLSAATKNKLRTKLHYSAADWSIFFYAEKNPELRYAYAQEIMTALSTRQQQEDFIQECITEHLLKNRYLKALLLDNHFAEQEIEAITSLVPHEQNEESIIVDTPEKNTPEHQLNGDYHAQEILHAFRRLGFYEVPTRTGHAKYVRQEENNGHRLATAIIPVHSATISHGLLRIILKQTHISIEDFLAAL